MVLIRRPYLRPGLRNQLQEARDDLAETQRREAAALQRIDETRLEGEISLSKRETELSEEHAAEISLLRVAHEDALLGEASLRREEVSACNEAHRDAMNRAEQAWERERIGMVEHHAERMREVRDA